MSRIIPSDIVWLCGQYDPEDDDSDMWLIVGVFTTEQKAIDACWSCLHFIAPLELDAPPDDDTGQWPGLYRPLVN